MKYILLIIFGLALIELQGQNLSEGGGLKSGGFHTDNVGNFNYTDYTWPKRSQGGETFAFIGQLTLKNVVFDGVKVTFYSAGGSCKVNLEGNITLRNGAIIVIQNNHGGIYGTTIGYHLQNYNISNGSSLVLKTNDILISPRGIVQDNSSLYILSSGKCTLGLGNYSGVGFKIGKEVITSDDYSKIVVISDDNMHLEGAVQAFGPGSYSFETDGNITLLGFRATWSNHDKQDKTRVFRFWCGNELGFYASPESSAPLNIGVSLDNPILSISNLFRVNQFKRYEQKWYKNAGEYFTFYNAEAKTNCDEQNAVLISEIINEDVSKSDYNVGIRSNGYLSEALKLFPNPGDGTSISFEADIEFDHAVIVKIFDYTGHLVDEKQVSHINGKGQFSMPELVPTGTYLIHLFDYYGQIIGYQKFVKK